MDFFFNSLQKLIYNFLEREWCIDKSEEYDGVFVKVVFCLEVYFLFIIFLNPNKVVAILEVELSTPLRALGFFSEFIY